MIIKKDNAIAEKDLQISKLITGKDAAVRDRERILAELKESQLKIDSLHQAHLIELEGLHIQSSNLRADNDHLLTMLAARDQEVKSLEEKCRNEQETLEEKQHSQIELFKRSHQEEIESLREHHAQQLTALEVKHCSRKQTIEEQHQVQLESKMNEISSLIFNKLSLALFKVCTQNLNKH